MVIESHLLFTEFSSSIDLMIIEHNIGRTVRLQFIGSIINGDFAIENYGKFAFECLHLIQILYSLRRFKICITARCVDRQLKGLPEFSNSAWRADAPLTVDA